MHRFIFSFLFSGVAAGFLFGLVVIFISMTSKGLDSAWVQAIGSLLMIGVAIFVPYKIEYNKVERAAVEVKVKAKVVAFLVRPFVFDMKSRVDDAIKRFNNFPHPDFGFKRGWVNEELIVPPGLLSMSSEYHLLGHASGALIDSILAIRRLDCEINSWFCNEFDGGVVFQDIFGDEQVLSGDADVVVAHRDAADKIDACISMLNKIVDGSS